jgi:hypothetical protein
MMFDWANVGLSARRSTPVERLVIVWCIIALLVVLAVICLWFGFTAPASKAAQAAQLRLYGYVIAGVAVAVWVGHRIVSWILDR